MAVILGLATLGVALRPSRKRRQMLQRSEQQIDYAADAPEVLDEHGFLQFDSHEEFGRHQNSTVEGLDSLVSSRSSTEVFVVGPAVILLWNALNYGPKIAQLAVVFPQCISVLSGGSFVAKFLQFGAASMGLGVRGAVASLQASSTASMVRVISQLVSAHGVQIAANTAQIATHSTQLASIGMKVANLGTQVAGNWVLGLANLGGVIWAHKRIDGVKGAVDTLAAQVKDLQILRADVEELKDVLGFVFQFSKVVGVSPQTLVTLLGAGAAIGPILGLAAIAISASVALAPPKKEEDPWLKVEARVAELIEGTWNRKRREEQKMELLAFLERFRKCQHGFIELNEIKLDSAQLLDDTAIQGKKIKWYSPLCLTEMETHMALTFHQWMHTDGDSTDALLIPFMELHTKVLLFLAMYPPKQPTGINYRTELQDRASEYALFLMKDIHSSFHHQTCRQVRLKMHTERGWVGSKDMYHLVVLRPTYQPHSGEPCQGPCKGKDSKQLWCNWCGGERRGGACCKAGDKQCVAAGLAQGFIPSATPVCVHTGCMQSNLAIRREIEGVDADGNFYAKDKQGGVSTEIPEIKGPEECELQCTMAGASECEYWSFEQITRKCTLLAGNNLFREAKQGHFSGKRDCPFSKNLNKAPGSEEWPDEMPVSQDVYETQPCNKESDANHLVSCYAAVLSEVEKDFNLFFERFGKTLDFLLKHSRCASPETAPDTAERKISFKQCEWQNPPPPAGGGLFWGPPVWQKDDLEKQRQMPPFPIPAWLEQRMSRAECLEKVREPAQVQTFKDQRNEDPALAAVVPFPKLPEAIEADPSTRWYFCASQVASEELTTSSTIDALTRCCQEDDTADPKLCLSQALKLRSDSDIPVVLNPSDISDEQVVQLQAASINKEAAEKSDGASSVSSSPCFLIAAKEAPAANPCEWSDPLKHNKALQDGMKSDPPKHNNAVHDGIKCGKSLAGILKPQESCEECTYCCYKGEVNSGFWLGGPGACADQRNRNNIYFSQTIYDWIFDASKPEIKGQKPQKTGVHRRRHRDNVCLQLLNKCSLPKQP